MFDLSSASKHKGLPDYATDPDSVLRDKVTWRFGRAPDYTMNRRTYAETKSKSHATDSIEHLVENLVKNWEVEASHKPILEEWRTIDPTTYTFSVNGGPSQTAKHMLQVGTYNAIISPNSYYSPENSSFETSHKTFKRMMPSFAWEVLEVYSPPPVVAFRWRHWGTMKSDYVGYNDQGCRIRIKAHGGQIDIQGVTVAKVNDKFQITSLETWFDPLEMFAQMRPDDKTLNVEFDDRDTPEEEDLVGLPDVDSRLQALLDKIDQTPVFVQQSVTVSYSDDEASKGSPNLFFPPSHPNFSGADIGTCPFLTQNS